MKFIKFITKSHIFLICMLCLSAIIAMKSLATPGIFTAHDIEAHITRLIEFHQALQDGQFPPRWAAGFFGGIGSPVLMLNYQLPYFFAEGFLRLGFSFVDAIKFTFAVPYLLSAVLMYLALVPVFGKRGAFVGAFLYTWASYRFVDIYVRAALGESFSFLFPPLILLGIHTFDMHQSISGNRKIDVHPFAFMTLGFALLFLSHPVASALYSLFFIAYACIYIFRRGFSSTVKRQFLTFFLSGMLAFGIAAFNLFPTLLLTNATHYTPSDSHPLLHFPSIEQLLVAHWGYGFSDSGEHDQMSFHLGYARMGIFFLTPLLLFFLFRRPEKLSSSVNKHFAMLALVVWFFAAAAIVLMLKYSTPVWVLWRLTRFIDFPWRILMIWVWLSSWLAAWFCSQFKGNFGIIVALLLVAVTMRSNINNIRINTVWPWGVEYYQRNIGTGDTHGEYAASTRATRNAFPITQRLEFIRGTGDIRPIKNLSHLIEAEVSTATSSALRINVMYFPGWKMWINGENQVIGQRCRITLPKLLTSDELDSSGLLVCVLQPGVNRIRAEYTAPSAQLLGNVVSLSSIVVYLWILFQSFFRLTTKPQTLSRSSAR